MFFSCQSISAQIISNLEIAKDTIEIGEATEIFFQLRFGKEDKIKLIDFSVFDSIESRFKSPSDTSSIPYFAEIEWEAGFMNFADKKLKLNPSMLISSNEGLEYRDTFHCTFWDIGVFPIPHPNIVVESEEEGKDPIYLEAGELIVLPPLGITNQDTTSAILDIDPIIPEAANLEDYLIYLYGLGLLLSLLAIFWLLKIRKQKLLENENEIKIIRPAHEVALEQLAELRSKKLWESGKIKEYQSELTHIIRTYLEHRYDMLALESTTDQILRVLKERNLDGLKQSTLREILQIADLVKFAKASPPVDIHESFLRKAENFIEETKEVRLSHTENLDSDV